MNNVTLNNTGWFDFGRFCASPGEMFFLSLFIYVASLYGKYQKKIFGPQLIFSGKIIMYIYILWKKTFFHDVSNEGQLIPKICLRLCGGGEGDITVLESLVSDT
jgi:hypothetical protein